MLNHWSAEKEIILNNKINICAIDDCHQISISILLITTITDIDYIGKISFHRLHSFIYKMKYHLAQASIAVEKSLSY